VLDEEGLNEGLRALAAFADLKAPCTAGHSRAVAGLAAAAARECRLPWADVALVRRAGWVHDLGRITVSAEVGAWGSRAFPGQLRC
jgi:HD-GYP domain-containing protein (c-di-GMP phosphodiesterase class II)